jgi:hypothetical protein
VKIDLRALTGTKIEKNGNVRLDHHAVIEVPYFKSNDDRVITFVTTYFQAWASLNKVVLHAGAVLRWGQRAQAPQLLLRPPDSFNVLSDGSGLPTIEWEMGTRPPEFLG